ncbi:hypothetical protein [Alloalcanivorax gelatiniphagus]|uniref:Transcriptional regulator SutA RNAP-binding domain-containing protein n=1 Tax=Alloalcanivorax gelatiniphagus TaxID=1194167 RepID=A0ABY2XJK1_9GAMM|nr:hypothetical protein [Alloalcanivorax gelatiniphagus]TMW12126.1 hypothetical protein FGS76_11565 [Alloalcanivorax gelatiniphagus]
MKVRNSKEQQRQRLREDMERFLSGGGRIKKVPSGTSGNAPDQPGDRRSFPFTQGPPATRTDLSKVAATIDARKKARRARRPAAKRGGPRRKLVYDDFGEPIRWVWED